MLPRELLGPLNSAAMLQVLPPRELLILLNSSHSVQYTVLSNAALIAVETSQQRAVRTACNAVATTALRATENLNSVQPI